MLRRVSTKAHFQLQFNRLEHVTKSGQIVLVSSCQYRKQAWYTQTFIMHTKAYFIVHTNIHFHTKAYHMVHTNINCAHQGILLGTYEHPFFTPRHITEVSS